VIELLLQAERTLAAGRIDEAERLYRQAVEADPRSSIAVVGLARVALERGDDVGAWRMGRRALEIDPENVAAQRLTQRLEEVYAYRGESIAVLATASTRATDPSPAPPGPPAPPGSPAQLEAASDPRIVVEVREPPTHPREPDTRSLVDRLLRRKPR
jgi:hypothetical protein